MLSWSPTRRHRRIPTSLAALIALLAGLLVAVTGPAAPAAATPTPRPCDVAGNLVDNCGFETDDFTSWDLNRAATGSVLFVTHLLSHTGADAVKFGAVGADDTISQPIAGTTEGQTYVVTFWLRNDDTAANNHFRVQVSDTAIGTVTLNELTDAAGFGWTLMTGSFVAGSATPVIAFSGSNPEQFFFLDDVAVAAAPASCAGVPGNLIGNCGFESPTLAPWTLTPAAFGGSASVVPGPVHSGVQTAYLAAIGSADDTFAQSIDGTSEGVTYLVQIWLRNLDDGNDNHLRAQVTGTAGGTKLLTDLTDVNGFGWTLFTGSFVAGSGAPTLSIAGRNQYAAFLIDDVSVSSLPPHPTVSPAHLLDASGAAAYLQPITATGATGPYSFAITAGSLPAGITLAGDGTLSGEPSAYGTFSFRVTATDADGYTGSRDYTLLVEAPTITLPSSLPDATYDTAYDQSVAAAGGTEPYTYVVSDGALPDGLTLNSATGAITGTPTSAGESLFTVRATDSGTGDQGPAVNEANYVFTVDRATPTLDVTAPTTGGVVGETAPITAVSSATGLSVAFSSGSPSVCSVSGTTVTYLHPGACQIDADQDGDTNHQPVATSATVPVGQASTTLEVSVDPHQIVATLAVTAPGAGAPTGTVSFAVDGEPVGDATVSGSTATLDYSVPTGMTRLVSAVYSGDDDFAGTSGSTSRHDPTITATVTSRRPSTGYGWYRTPIRVHFQCTPNGAPLVGDCPATVVLRSNGAGMSVTRTVMAADGGAATAAVTGLNLDRTAPRVRVRGIRNGAVYGGYVPAARCVAHDRLSGVAGCHLHRHRVGIVVRYRAVAVDRAGNRSVVRGHYRVPHIYLAGVAFRDGAWQVRLGHSYPLVVTHAGRQPRYVDAAPDPRLPAGPDNLLTRTGHHRWAITVTIERALGHDRRWNLGIRIAGHLHRLRIHTR